MADPLAEAPKTLENEGEEALQQARAWVQGGHPRACWERLVAFDRDTALEYQTLFGVTLAHMIEEHTAEALRLARLTKDLYVHRTDQVGIDRAIANRSKQLGDILVDEWDDLAEVSSGPWFVNLIASHLRGEDFKRVWHAAWDKPDAGAGPLLKSLLWAANAHDGFTEQREAFLGEKLEEVADILGVEQTVRYAAHAPFNGGVRDKLLNRLLDAHGIVVARLFASRIHQPRKPSSAVLRAYLLLREEDPYSAETQGTLVGALLVDPKGVARDVAKLVNEDGIAIVNGARFHMMRELAWAIPSGLTAELFRSIAEDALAREEKIHDILAQQAHILRAPVDLIIGWVKETIGRREAVDYNAGLLRLYLSDEGVAKDAKEWMADLAEALFAKYGKLDKTKVFERFNVKSASKVHKAVALMRTLGDPPPTTNVEAIIRTLREYPTTREALGGEAFEQWLRKNPDEFVNLYWYQRRPVEVYRDLSGRGSANLDVRAVAWSHRRLEEELAFRVQWEQRFKRLRKHGINLKRSGLRTSHDTWIEAMIGARLLEGGFEIRYEPSDVLSDGPDLDYLVKDPISGHEFFLEVQRLGTRPDEVLDKVHVGFGGEPKKSLQNKLNKQLRGGRIDPHRPLIIALEVPSIIELRHSLPNSLYGVLQVGYSMEDGATMSEGIERDTEDKKGLFYEREATFVSGILAFAAEQPGAAHLEGRMFWPSRRPPHTLAPQTYVGLRKALLGDLPEWAMEQMMEIPTITKVEAEALVRAGVDSPGLLVTGQVEFNTFPLGKTRLEQLTTEIHWLHQVQKYGRIELLKTARGIDLTPLHAAGIRTLLQLQETNERPSDLPEGIWNGLRLEAARVGFLKPPEA